MGVPMVVGFVVHIMGDGQLVLVRPAAFDQLEAWFGPGPDLVGRYDRALEGDWEIEGLDLVGAQEMAHFMVDWRDQGDIVLGFMNAMHDGRAARAPMKVIGEVADQFDVTHVVDDGWLLVTLMAPSEIKTDEQRERDDLEYRARLDSDLFRSLLDELLAYRKAASC